MKGSGNTNVLCYGNQSGTFYESPITINSSSSPSMPVGGIAVDTTGEHVYFVANNGTSLCIRRTTSLTLSANAHDVWINSGGSFGIQKIVLDLNNRKIYWTSDTNNTIYRANLDDAVPTAVPFLTGLGSKPTGIAITQ